MFDRDGGGDLVELGPNEPMDALFFRELAEIYLLVDHISSHADKRLPFQIDVDGDGKPDRGDWLSEICELTWPPKGSAKDVAHQAVFLIRTRDALNRVASPATGASIAFTIMAVDADLPMIGGGAVDVGGPEGLAVATAAAGLRPRLSEGGERPRTDHRPVSDPITGLTRHDLASQAFPNLRAPAKSFALFNRWVVVALFLWLLITLVLSWNIATGSNLLSQLHTSRLEYEDAAKVVAPTTTAARAAAISHLNFLSGRYTAARVNVANWAQGWQLITRWPWQWDWGSFWRFGPGEGASADLDNNSPTAIAPALWASGLNNVLGNSILPARYGLLGALAAVVRVLSERMRESVLTQRDHLQSWIQLALGAVIGACIGLFVTPSGGDSADAPGLLGTARISASALCFLAGFGVEHVFKALEALLGRLFTIAAPVPKRDDGRS